MSNQSDKSGGGCSGGCRHCSEISQCEPAPGALRGWALTGASACMFLLPLASAVAGAALAGPERTAQFAGAMIGLVAGLAVGVVLARLAGRPSKEKSKS